MRRPDTSATRNFGIAFGALIASSATLVCCVLPALLVALGAGAALAGLVNAIPQLIWLSEHKGIVFGVAGILLTVSSAALWRVRSAPCPVDPVVARACLRLRRVSWALNSAALVCFAVGVTFAFVLPKFL